MMPDFSAWTPMEIVRAFNHLNAVDKTIGLVVLGVFATRFAVVPFVRACKGKRDA